MLLVTCPKFCNPYLDILSQYTLIITLLVRSLQIYFLFPVLHQLAFGRVVHFLLKDYKPFKLFYMSIFFMC